MYLDLYLLMNMETIHQTLSDLKGITFCSQNVRSLCPLIDEVKLLLQQTSIDFLLLQETFLNESVSDPELEIPKYRSYRLDRGDNTDKVTGGGLLCYVSDKYDT